MKASKKLIAVYPKSITTLYKDFSLESDESNNLILNEHSIHFISMLSERDIAVINKNYPKIYPFTRIKKLLDAYTNYLLLEAK